MTFTSFNFLIFFPLLAVIYYLFPARLRWIVLLIASYFFYINIKPVYALLTTGITLSTYLFTRLIDKSDSEPGKKAFMIINVVLILLPLFFFKYFGAINSGVLAFLENHNLRWPLPEIKLLLPVGISFYTFMAVGYTIDVYNEEIKVEKNIGILALFVSFFPLVLSGPIERAKNMLPQFRSRVDLNYANVIYGLKLMLWGYFMKLVVADRTGIYIDAVFNNFLNHNGTSLLIASLLRPFQVYTDLGGYSLIAIGTARILGFKVMCNFNRPFFATSMGEFWRRWHISLITWLTDYIYTPLSFTFRKLRIWGIVLALLITFLISGIWHEASWNYVVWGIIQGIFLSLEALNHKTRAAFEKKYAIIKSPVFIFLSIVVTYLLFSGSLIFGRAGSLSNAVVIYHKILTNHGTPYLDLTTLAYSFLGIFLILFKDFTDEYYPDKVKLFENKRVWVRYGSYLLILFIILLFVVFECNKFIYFQF